MGLFSVSSVASSIADSQELKIDFEQLTETIAVYQSLITELETVKTQANTAIKVLEGTKWNSAASEAFFSVYSTNWTIAFDEQLKSLEHLVKQLISARAEYERLYEEIDQIARSVQGVF